MKAVIAIVLAHDSHNVDDTVHVEHISDPEACCFCVRCCPTTCLNCGAEGSQLEDECTGFYDPADYGLDTV